MMEQYKGAAFGELSPHLFAVADTCYRYIHINVEIYLAQVNLENKLIIELTQLNVSGQ